MEYSWGYCSLRSLAKDTYIKTNGGSMGKEIRMTDSEIYQSEAYRNINASVAIALVSGVFLCMGCVLFYFNKPISWILGTIVASLVGFLIALFVGRYKLFPTEEYEDGVSEHDDKCDKDEG